MKHRYPIRTCYLTLLLLGVGCIEPYEPRVNQSVLDILVVDGFMNATEGTASVRLSHTQSLSETKDTRHESGATVFIRSGNGWTIELAEQDSGTYLAKDINIDLNTIYSLHIKTTSGTEYESDTVRIKETPPIDNLNYGVTSDGQNLKILVDTHDPLGKSRFYKWDYVETYEYKAAYYSGYRLVNHEPVIRKQEEQVYTCWRTDPSTSISIRTTNSLSEDVIYRHQLTTIPKSSPKVSERYSILVKQMAISREEYDYLEQLRKITENLGTIFGNLPSSVAGNMHQVGNRATTVLGYFSGAEVKEKRFFIERSELPPGFGILSSKIGCLLEETCPIDVPNAGFCTPLSVVGEGSVVIYANTPPGARNPSTYTFTSSDCGDCRSKGGTTKKPSFW